MDLSTIAFLVGRLLLGIYFVMAGTNHFMHRDMMTAMTASKGLPVPTLAVLGSGALLVLVGISLVLGLLPMFGLLAAIAFLVSAALLFHDFWTETDAGQRAAQMVHFLKNIALAAATLMLLAVPTPWPLSLS